MSDASRLEALALAGDLPGVLLDARRLAASAPGLHGRRRSGQGEAFWQYRDHRAEDGARLVDWRRSARGDRYFVREREREAAQTAWFWMDPDAGFNWSSDTARTTKLRRAQTMALALATLLNRGGERIGMLGRAPRTGPRAIDRLAHDFLTPQAEADPPSRACMIFFSDFYAPVETWRARLSAAAGAGASGALVMIADPAEEQFPFRGRTLFLEPGRSRSETLLGRAEAVREAYTARLETHRRAIRQAGSNFGFPALLHRTDHGAAPALALLTALVSERFA
ncbi:DUF58 domain-containing protein [Candidatus Viadribacter manganicus]|uniref:DUF58 domain-containing protein n=1 Tax=Candidatus Viadribacter manganicus TaxID=1759059 RepID=A0A1B1AGA8_9PROT|nr:DUF58 domain-containing protein [Candidatus Viadribacter manganicus]ANP45587.1 hypothetical protein ATE48_06475 [Candidatus Viadribacter manganicus]